MAKDRVYWYGVVVNMIILHVQQIQIQEITELRKDHILYQGFFFFLLFKNTLRSVIELTIFDLCRWFIGS